MKRAVQHTVAAVAPQLWRWRRRPTLLVLMYHRVLPVGHPERASEQPGMYVSPPTLDMQLGVLKELFTLLHLDEWLAAVAAGKPVPRRACAITFDDGWRDNHEYAFPILERHAAPATVYLVTDLIGTRYSFWPNTLAKILAADSSDAMARLPAWLRQLARPNGIADSAPDIGHIDAVIDTCKQSKSDAEMLAALHSLADVGGAQRDLMNWEEIQRWHAGGLIRFGSHTRRHSRLDKIDSTAQLMDEIVGSRTAIEERLGAMPQTFCYPNGDFSPRAVQIVRGNFKGAVTTARGWNRTNSDACLLNRVGMHEDVSSSRAVFLARLAGVG